MRQVAAHSPAAEREKAHRGARGHAAVGHRPRDQPAGTSTRSIVWMTPLDAWMLIFQITRRGSASAGVSSRSVMPRGFTMPPLAMVSDLDSSTWMGPSFLPATTWYSRMFEIWSAVNALVMVASAAASDAGADPVRSLTSLRKARSLGANTVYFWLVSASAASSPVATRACTRMS